MTRSSGLCGSARPVHLDLELAGLEALLLHGSPQVSGRSGVSSSSGWDYVITGVVFLIICCVVVVLCFKTS